MPKWRNRISPLFDASSRILIADIDNDGILNSIEVEISSGSEQARISALVDNKVDVLICGGISRVMEEMVLSRGIKLVSGIKGSVNRIMNIIIEGGRFDTPSFTMPGCRRRKGFQKGCRGRGGRKKQSRED